VESAWTADAVPRLDEQALEPSAVTSSASADSWKAPANTILTTFLL